MPLSINNISVIPWWSVLLVEETRGPEKTTIMSQVTDKLDHIMAVVAMFVNGSEVNEQSL
jgi:hypothetical protein